MGTKEAQALYSEAQREMLQIAGEIDVDAAVELNRILTKILIEDIEFALSKGVENQLWKMYRSLIDSVTSSKEIAKSHENVVNMTISWISQLSLHLHLHYQLFPHELASALSVSTAVAGGNLKKISEDDRHKILGFIAFRMGDLMRYKNELEISEKFYQMALKLQPSRGDIWNQLGLMAKIRGSLLDSIYYHVRALHAPVSFQPASTNISTILRKFSEKEDVAQGAPFHELYLTVLGKLQFMQPIPEHLIDRLGSQLIEVRTIAPLLSIYSALEENTDDEKNTKQAIEQLLKLSFEALIDKFESAAGVDGSLLSCLSLLLRLPANWQPNEAVAARLEEVTSLQAETDYLVYFRCLEDPFDYPLQWTQLRQLLTSIEKKSNEDPKKKGKK